MRTIYKKLLFLLLILPFSVLAQTVIGTVTDTSGQPVPGANVVIEGSSAGVQTDFDGKFQLADVKSGDVIVISFLGYKNSTFKYSGQANFTVTLEEEANQLNEVVVQVGYGAVSRRDATGSVTVVTAGDFNKGPVVSADQLLTGKAAGVRITTNGGQPDAAPNIRIRGGASLFARNEPLIIIDGVPIDNVTPAGISNPFSLVNPNDIESFSILKDASATAIYGSRASNGVIIITTKKGSSGAPQFNFSSSLSIGSVSDKNKINMMDGPTFARFIQQNHPEYTNNLGIDDPATDAVDDPTTFETDDATDPALGTAAPLIEGRILYDTDWQDAIYRQSYSSDNNFSVRANVFKKLPLRFSLGYLNSEGLVRTNDFERISGSLKLTPMLLDNHLKIDINAKVLNSKKNAIDEGGVFGSALNMDPTKPIYGESPNNRFGGYYQNYRLNGDRYIKDGADNPVAVLNQRERPEEVKKLLGNVEFDYKLHFFSDLRAVVNLGLEASRAYIREEFSENSLQTYQFNQTDTNPDTNYLFNPGVNYRESQHITNKLLESYLVYNKSMTGIVTRINAQAGYSYQNFVNDGNKINYQYNTTTGLREVKIDNQNENNRYYNVQNLQSFFGRTNFDLLDKYLFTLTLRADASSFFNEDNRWGYFPAAGFAWRVSDESFLKNSKTVRDLKIRLGYGITGQQDIANVEIGGAKVGFYPNTPLFAPASVNSQYLPGIKTYSALPFDDTLTWEKTTTYNVGLDFSLFGNGIVGGSIDLYSRETTDLLAAVNGFPGQSLRNVFISNVGSMTSKGAELGLNIKPITTDNFSWELYGNIAFNEGEITDLKNVTSVQDITSTLPTQTGLKLANQTVGEQPYSAYVYEQIYDAAGNPIQNAFVDRNNDGTISDADRYYEAIRPNWTFGFGTSVNYKNLDLSSSFRGQIGGKVYNSRNLVAGYVDRARPVNSSSLSNVLDAYLPFQNIQEKIPFSDYYLEDASFLRCENITLGYKFADILQRKSSSSLRFYVSVNNLFVVSDYSGQDPENFNGIDNNFYPRPTVYSMGVNFDF